MPVQDRNAPRILVTGGSGYLGCWIVAALLRQGYRVRTTVRDPGAEWRVRTALAADLRQAGALGFAQADLGDDASWDAACAGCDGVVHAASPMPGDGHRRRDLDPLARDGTRRVLRAAERAGVARVVMTSSSRAAHLVSDSGIVIDERCWSDPRSRSLDAYSRAKILAERSAWEFMQGVRSGMTLATVLPSLVQGPLFGPLRSPSLAVTALLLQGGLRRIPPLGFNIVDVRDLADLHLRALFDPAAAGQRFVGTGGFLWMREIAALLRGRFPQQADAVPTRMAPAAMMGVEMLVNAELRRLLPRLRVRRDYTAAKAERLLHWTPRDVASSVLDCARSLLLSGHG